MSPQIPVPPPPPGYSVVVISKNEPIPPGALIVHAANGCGPVKRCYYVPLGSPCHQGSVPNYYGGPSLPNYPHNQPQYVCKARGVKPAIAPQKTLVRGKKGSWDVFGCAISKGKTYTFKEDKVETATGDAHVLDSTGEMCLFIKEQRSRVFIRDVCFNSGEKIAEVIHNGSGEEIRHTDGTMICTVLPYGAIGKKLKVEMEDGRYLHLDGGIRGKNFSLTHNDHELLRVSRNRSVTAMISGKDTYTVSVNDNFDWVLGMCLTLIIDDIFHDEKEAKPD